MYIIYAIGSHEPTPVFSGLDFVKRTEVEKVLTHEKYSLVAYKDKEVTA